MKTFSERAQEVLDRADEAGYFDDCADEAATAVRGTRSSYINALQKTILAKARALLGELGEHVEVTLGKGGSVRAVRKHGRRDRS